VSDTPPAPSPFEGGATTSNELSPARVAAPDHSGETERHGPVPRSLVEPHDEVNVIRIIKVYESSPKYESSTALGDALAKAGLDAALLADREAHAPQASELPITSDAVEAI